MSAKYDPKTREPHWQQRWQADGVYDFKDDQPNEQTFVIDTPPPTVSGVLHMGHIFSYTQADFIARYKRMRGFDVFYPMGFDDNGLPTERLVEKVKKIRAHAYIQEHGREAFVELCQDVVDEAEAEFKRLFQSVALSVDWNQLYQTISDEVTALSQASFLDLIDKGEAYRDFRPTYWDWKDGTALANAEIEEKELPGIQCHIPFGIMDKHEWDVCANAPDHPRPEFDALEQVMVMTTRPELLGACVALMIHPDDAEKYKGKVAITPLFNVVVPIVADERVDKEKGTGFVMCCSWGDDTDKEWIAEHELAWRPLIGMDGKLSTCHPHEGGDPCSGGEVITFRARRNDSNISNANCFDITATSKHYLALAGTKLIRDTNNENSAKGRAIQLLNDANLLKPSPNPLPEGEGAIIKKTQTVKCAERSGCPIEIVPTDQWFVKIVDKKEAIKEKAGMCDWNPDYMRIRLDQWADNLKEDWCISRQRFFGVPFPVWYSKRNGEEGKLLYAKPEQLPCDPFTALPEGYSQEEVVADPDVMDTWATSSISPQINAYKSCGSAKRSGGESTGSPAKDPVLALRAPRDVLYPADLRPQAHEIIRTWAFYTIVKSHLHADIIPWKHLMISGWCLASDKTKMSKSKGNVVTPVELIEDKGADAVRYWASTSRLGADTAFSEDLLKIGKKLVTKLYNASNFAGQHLSHIETPDFNAEQAVEKGLITEMLDKWILTRLYTTIDKATHEFERFEYAAAREVVEEFFWKDFCDNYLELVKARAYGQQPTPPLAGGHGGESLDVASPSSASHSTPPASGGSLSAIHTLHYCLNTILKLFAPFVPHITEELYSTLFTNEHKQRGSIHARNQWPVKEDFIHNSVSETLGMAVVEILEAIRKSKSEASVSIKYPVSQLRIAKADFRQDINQLGLILDDLKAAGNVNHVELANTLDDGVETDGGNFHVEIKLAEQAATA